MIGLLLPVMVLQGVLFTALLFCTSLHDLKTRQIPDSLPLAIGAVGLLHFSPFPAFFGLLVTGLPYLIAAMLSKGKIGGGDIKLMAACGFVLGPAYGTLQSMIGLSLVLLVAAGIGFRFGFQTAKQTALPLAPFLSAGGVLAFLIS
ncbi:leader peptidase (prepilin peptidase) / N-methyltransferase [Paenibacillus sophorae]|nr:A24 family peptidase [Paenibacillus sophorae]SEP01244.1 leader peptidase (prepilin peptidase) / N-methyltransferase [Paenibacillus sophorae]